MLNERLYWVKKKKAGREAEQEVMPRSLQLSIAQNQTVLTQKNN